MIISSARIIQLDQISSSVIHRIVILFQKEVTAFDPTCCTSKLYMIACCMVIHYFSGTECIAALKSGF